MKTGSKKIIIHDYEEFLRVYFPPEKEVTRIHEDPYKYGVEIARDSIRQLKKARKKATAEK